MNDTNKTKINKCDYGYLKNKLNKEIIKTIILFAVPIAIIIFGYIKEGTNKNIFTLIAVLGLLPAANNFVTTIMVIKAQKWSCSKELYEKIASAVDLAQINVRFDLYMTGYEKTFPIQSICCVGNSLIGYTNSKDYDDVKFEDHLKPLLSQNSLKVGTIKIFTNEDKYIARLSEERLKQDDHDNAVLHLMENISL